MLAELKMTIVPEGENPQNKRLLTYRKASVFQSIMMERISPEYAHKLHQQELRPYSQTIYYDKEQTYWTVRTFSDEAYELIIKPLMDPDWTEFYLEHNQIKIKITERVLSMTSTESLMKDFYLRKDNPYISIRFVTPTAFKQNNRYVNLPDVRLIYQSLMNKCSATIEGVDFFDEETLDELVEHTRIAKYSLRSSSFPVAGTVIPAFCGDIVFQVKGPAVMVNFANLLFSLGFYTGIGIKAAIGMGSIRKIQGNGGMKDD